MHSRLRPEDLVVNQHESEQWLADDFRLPIETVPMVLSFYKQHQAELAPTA